MIRWCLSADHLGALTRAQLKGGWGQPPGAGNEAEERRTPLERHRETKHTRAHVQQGHVRTLTPRVEDTLIFYLLFLKMLFISH